MEIQLAMEIIPDKKPAMIQQRMSEIKRAQDRKDTHIMKE